MELYWQCKDKECPCTVAHSRNQGSFETKPGFFSSSNLCLKIMYLWYFLEDTLAHRSHLPEKIQFLDFPTFVCPQHLKVNQDFWPQLCALTKVWSNAIVIAPIEDI